MAIAHIIDPEEFVGRYAPVAHEIFSGANFVAIRDIKERPVFRATDWHPIAIPFEFRLDSGREEEPNHVSSYAYHDEYDPLFQTLRSRAVAEIALTAKPMWPECPFPDFVCSPTRDAINQAMRMHPAIGPMPICVFDETATWGLCSNGEIEGYSVIAGTKAFMADLIARYGGLDRIKRRFWDFNTKYHRWPIADDLPWCGDWKALGWGEAPKAWPATSE